MERGNFENRVDRWDIERTRDDNARVGRTALGILKNLESANSIDNIGTDELFSIFEKDKNPENLMNFESSPEEIESWLIDNLAAIRDGENGDITKIGILSGSFDVPHENHTWYLRHAKSLLAEEFLRENDLPVSEEHISEVIQRGLVRLIASVDTNQEVSQRKSKPGDIRPIYDFYDRAKRIAELTLTAGDQILRAVDFVIPEGPEYAESDFEKTPTLAKKLSDIGLLDSAICFEESQTSIERYQNLGIKPIIVPQSVVYATNPLTGQRISTSAILQNIRNQNQTGGKEWISENQQA